VRSSSVSNVESVLSRTPMNERGSADREINEQEIFQLK
jgi:hypothetical protein